MSERRWPGSLSQNAVVDRKEPRIFRAGVDAVEVESFPERRLWEAIARWDSMPFSGPASVIGAACDALVAGLDSPALRALAAMPEGSPRDDVEAVVGEALDELGIPRAGDLRHGLQIVRCGGIKPRPGTDHVRFEVKPVCEAVGGYEVLVFVNGTEMTAAGAGMGMDPYDVFVPVNRLAATTEARRVPIARCECGVSGCGVTDVSILRDGDLVHWDWHEEVPMNRGVTFPAAEYDAEVARLAADRAWESPDRVAGRMILTDVDSEALSRHDLRVSWVANDYRDSSRFCVCLLFAQSHQVFLYTRWENRTPAELAALVVQSLRKRPSSWRAEWHAIQPGLGPPALAGRRWRHHKLP
jgi:hypothetical protein